MFLFTVHIKGGSIERSFVNGIRHSSFFIFASKILPSFEKNPEPEEKL